MYSINRKQNRDLEKLKTRIETLNASLVDQVISQNKPDHSLSQSLRQSLPKNRGVRISIIPDEQTCIQTHMTLHTLPSPKLVESLKANKETEEKLEKARLEAMNMCLSETELDNEEVSIVKDLMKLYEVYSHPQTPPPSLGGGLFGKIKSIPQLPPPSFDGSLFGKKETVPQPPPPSFGGGLFDKNNDSTLTLHFQFGK